MDGWRSRRARLGIWSKPGTEEAPSSGSEIARDEIHLWCASLLRVDPALQALLDDDEVAAAARLRSATLRRRYLVRRAFRRTVLGRYARAGPSAIRYRAGPGGRPELAWSEEELEFNASDSDEVAVLAVTRGQTVGVDVEVIRPIGRLGLLIESSLDAQERATLATGADERAERFLALWAAKEALAKRDGLATELEPQEIPVELTPAASATWQPADGRDGVLVKTTCAGRALWVGVAAPRCTALRSFTF
ncbi:MAG: 4'-phosphopantetheinyl transferase family protein [Polyangia bacterium]